MSRIVRTVFWTLAAGLLVLATTGEAAAQGVVPSSYCPPTVSYYAPAPTVSYYAAPAVSYYAPQVSYYAPPTVSYYAPPTVSYYAAPAVSYYAAPAVSYYAGSTAVTRYGLFGRPRATYYYPGYVVP
jgi:hypothetical protein